MSADAPLVTVDIIDHVARIGLNRPAKKNAFNLALLRQLADAYTAADENPEVRCLLLYAHGDAFTTGLELNEVGPAVAEGTPLFPDDLVDPLSLGPRRRTKPVVVAVQGWCLTIGIELILAADIAVAAEGARFAQMEVQRGILAFGGATLRFARLGWGNAMLHLLTGDRFDAAEALRIGLVQRVTPAEGELDGALEIATRIAAQAPLAVQATLQSCRTAVEQGDAAAKSGLLDHARRLMQTADAAEGVASFVERREARFRGK